MGRIAVVVLALLTPVLGVEASQVTINGNFEGPYNTITGYCSTNPNITGEIAQGWADNSCWSGNNVSVAYAQSGTAHEGSRSQRITISSIESASQVQLVQPVTLTPGSPYRFSAWVRSSSVAAIELVLRQGGTPYTDYAIQIYTADSLWKKISVIGVAGTDPAALLMFRVRSYDLPGNWPMDIFIDQASLELLTDAQPGNLLPNGSFEAGFGNGWTATMRGSNRFDATAQEFSDPQPTIAGGADPNVSGSGSSVVNIPVPGNTDALVSSPPLPIYPGRSYCGKLGVRATYGGATAPQVDLYLATEKDQAGAPRATVTVGASGTWTEPFVCGIVPAAAFAWPSNAVPRLWVKLRTDGIDEAAITTFSLDAAHVEQATTPASYVPYASKELTFKVPRSGSIYFDGESAQINVSVKPVPLTGLTLALSMVDLYGSTAAVNVPANSSSVTLPPSLFPHTRGLFKVTGVVKNSLGVAVSAPVEVLFARLPQPVETDAGSSFFGIHIPLSPDYIAIARNTGHRWVRIHDASQITKWFVVERTSQGGFTWYDAPVNAARAAGLRILGMLDTAPPWASTQFQQSENIYYRRPNRADAQIDGRARYRNYVTAIVSHFAGRIDDWEVWNEPYITGCPNGGVDCIPPNSSDPTSVCADPAHPDPGATHYPFYPCGLVSDFELTLEDAYTSAKAGNVSANIVAPCTTPGFDQSWGAPLLANDQGKCSQDLCFDTLSFHDYISSFVGGDSNEAFNLGTSYQNLQLQGPYTSNPRPSWNTENGLGFKSGSWYGSSDLSTGYPPRLQALQGVRQDVSMLAGGVRHNFYYWAQTDTDSAVAGFSALEYDRSIRANLAARAVLASLVEGATFISPHTTTGGIDHYTFSRADGSTLDVLWSNDGVAHTYSVSNGAAITDLFGNGIVNTGSISVTFEPVYIITPR